LIHPLILTFSPKGEKGYAKLDWKIQLRNSGLLGAFNSLRSFSFWIFWLAAICCSPSAVAETPGNGNQNDSPIIVDAETDKSPAMVGDLIAFSLTLRYNPEIEPVPPDFSGYFEGFEIVETQRGEPLKKGGQMELVHRYRLRADKVGVHKIPSLPVNFSFPNPEKPDAFNEGQILTPEVVIEVKSILRLQGEPTDIRDIKPPAEFEEDSRKYYYGAFMLLALAGLGLWLYLLREKKAASSGAVPPAAMLPHELAIRQLHELRSRQLLEKGQFARHYFELSEIFRRYLQNRYHFPALDWTTEEIAHKLHGFSEIPPVLGKTAVFILEQTDQVKFAQVIPSQNVSGAIMNSILRFVQSTQPSENANTPTNNVRP
jgi:hypothetical protein